MRNLLIVSDSHHDIEKMEKLFKKYQGYYIIHCGDYCIPRELLDKYDVHYVDGNCDMHDDRLELFFELDNEKIYVTHGHKQRVKMGYMNLYYKAIELVADYVFFGHTHEKTFFEDNNIKFINPGSLRYEGSYAVIENDKVYFKEI